jgi:protein-S-isoprenylcysteine O-methyltransferase Ste14
VNARPDRKSKLRAAIGSLAFFVLAPGVVGGLIPWSLTRWESETPLPFWAPLRIVGACLIGAGMLALVLSFVRFVVEGLGTPAPVAPTEHLVVGGLYRYVRNPMYLAVAAIIFGQALALGRPVLFAYGAVFCAVVAAFVRWYEEPTLARTFGREYDEYRQAVPAWRPRRRPWQPRSADAERARSGV